MYPPLSPDYPWYTTYQFAGNKPIIAIDLDGLEEFVTTDGKLIYSHKKNGVVYVVSDFNIKLEMKEVVSISMNEDGTTSVQTQIKKGKQNPTLLEEYSKTASGSLEKNSAEYKKLMAWSNSNEFGNVLMNMYSEDPLVLNSGDSWNCSPTSFKRYNEAYKRWSGKSDFNTGGTTYAIWNMYGMKDGVDWAEFFKVPEEFKSKGNAPVERSVAVASLRSIV